MANKLGAAWWGFCCPRLPMQSGYFGVAPDTTFEIGSITKGMTGLLFAHAIRRGELSASVAS